MKLERVEIEGYRSIRKASVELRALNILIGANGAGKSNLIGALAMLNALAEHQLGLFVGRRGGANALLHFGAKRTPRLRIAVAFDEASAYAIELESAPRDAFLFVSERVVASGDPNEAANAGYGEALFAFGPPDVRGVATVAAMRAWRVFHFRDTSSTADVKGKRPLGDNRALRSDGGNVAALLYRLQQGSPYEYRRIQDAVRAVAPFFDSFRLAPDALDPSVIQLEWRHRTDPSYFDAHALSDGTLRFMCLATMLLQPDLPSLIVVDEPELGLHPAAVEILAGLLRSAAEKTQVIVATQSVTLLDQFAVEDLIVVDRQNGESLFRRLEPDELQSWLDDYSLGDLWMKNVLGGLPSFR